MLPFNFSIDVVVAAAFAMPGFLDENFKLLVEFFVRFPDFLYETLDFEIEIIFVFSRFLTGGPQQATDCLAGKVEEELRVRLLVGFPMLCAGWCW